MHTAIHHHLRIITDTRATLGEGAIWSPRDGRLYWVDIIEGVVHSFEPASGNTRTFSARQFVSTVVPRRSGGLLVALHDSIAALGIEDGATRVIRDRIHDSSTHRFNDGKCDPAGRLWVGSIALNESLGTSALYRIDADHHVTCMCTGITNSNGIAWSLDHKTMYYIDTPTRQISAFDFDVATGDIQNRRVAVIVPEEMGYPDGMTIDAEGCLWVALWGGACVSRWDPRRGELLSTIDLPTSHVTSCAFGGARLRQLYITTARMGLDDAALREQPLAGALFCVDADVAGIPAFEFAG